jgi:hypothetical protein
MLRWTCRLRNVLERRGSLSEIIPSWMPEMREAEFVSSESGTFPDEFRWDAFQESCDSHLHAIILDVVPAVDATTTGDRTFCSLSWQPLLDFSEKGINILWLSSTIFISPMLILPDNDTALHEYMVGFRDRINRSSTQYFVYSLSAFQGGEVREPSLLPWLFFAHLPATLQVDYFSDLWLHRVTNKLHLCPVDCIIHFLSIMSNSDLRHVTTNEKVTIFRLSNCYINADEIGVILSHKFHPTVKLEIDGTGVDATVSLDIMVDCLKNVPHLRAIELPQHLLRAGTAEDSARIEEITIKFPCLSVTMGYGHVSPQALLKISRIHPANEIIASLDWEFLEKNQQRPAKAVGSFLRPLLDGQLTSETLRGTFVRERGKDYSNRVSDLVASEMISCESKSLCFFTLTERIRNESGDDIWNFDRIKHWDQVIFPTVVLNYFRKRASHPLDLRVLPMAIGAVNHGNIYRKATDHVPYDMSIANAGVIFRCVKTQSRSGFPDFKYVQAHNTSFCLCGRKRSPP